MIITQQLSLSTTDSARKGILWIFKHETKLVQVLSGKDVRLNFLSGRLATSTSLHLCIAGISEGN